MLFLAVITLATALVSGRVTALLRDVGTGSPDRAHVLAGVVGTFLGSYLGWHEARKRTEAQTPGTASS